MKRGGCGYICLVTQRVSRDRRRRLCYDSLCHDLDEHEENEKVFLAMWRDEKRREKRKGEVDLHWFTWWLRASFISTLKTTISILCWRLSRIRQVFSVFSLEKWPLLLQIMSESTHVIQLLLIYLQLDIKGIIMLMLLEIKFE